MGSILFHFRPFFETYIANETACSEKHAIGGLLRFRIFEIEKCDPFFREKLGRKSERRGRSTPPLSFFSVKKLQRPIEYKLPTLYNFLSSCKTLLYYLQQVTSLLSLSISFCIASILSQVSTKRSSDVVGLKLRRRSDMPSLALSHLATTSSRYFSLSSYFCSRSEGISVALGLRRCRNIRRRSHHL